VQASERLRVNMTCQTRESIWERGCNTSKMRDLVNEGSARLKRTETVCGNIKEKPTRPVEQVKVKGSGMFAITSRKCQNNTGACECVRGIGTEF